MLPKMIQNAIQISLQRCVLVKQNTMTKNVAKAFYKLKYFHVCRECNVGRHFPLSGGCIMA